MSRVLIVTGMHRSGTSLLANWLERAGLHMGEEHLPADVGNPLGYYEDVAIHDLHRELLWKAGVDDAFTVRDEDVPIGVDDVFRDRAKAIVDARSHLEQWGWKEPRTALFLDLWASLLDDATYLFPFREPTAVLDSLLRRATNESVNDDPVVALRLWRIHNEQMVRFADGHPGSCIWVQTDTFLDDTTPAVDALTQRGFTLKPPDMSDVYVPDAFHTDVRMRARRVAKKHKDEGRRCAELYDRLCTLAA